MIETHRFQFYTTVGDLFEHVLSLMQRQNDNIQQAYGVITRMWSNVGVVVPPLVEITRHLGGFVQSHYASVGFVEAIWVLQAMDKVFIDYLLGRQILSAAEQLEAAAGTMEALGKGKSGVLDRWADLNETIAILEETQLRIIEILEEIRDKCYKNSELLQ